MPPAVLSPDILDRLPAPLKRLAISAIDGPPEQLHALGRRLNLGPEHQRGPIIYVLYTILDPARIPSVADLDGATAPNPSVSKAFLALGHLIEWPSPPRGVGLQIWERAWPWIQFLHTYRESLVADFPLEAVLYYILIKLLAYLQRQWTTDDLGAVIRATPGARTVVAVGWLSFVDSGGYGPGLTQINAFVQQDSGGGALLLEEYLEGSGGTCHDLAYLVVHHIKHALKVQPLSVSAVVSLSVATLFLRDAMTGDEQPFGWALLTHGLVPTLTEATYALSIVASPDTSVLPILFYQLRSALEHFPGYLWIVEALKAGLLRTIMISAGSQDEVIQQELDHLVCKTIPEHLLYRSVVVAFREALPDVTHLQSYPKLQKSSLFPSWLALLKLAELRFGFVEEAEEGLIPFKACDNVECGRIESKSQLQRCCGCLEFYYCSRKCQRADWTTGHRETCKSYRGFRSVGGSGCRDTQFFYDVVKADYFASRADILAQKLAILKQDPTALLYTTFTYDDARVIVTVKPVSEPPVPPEDHARWADAVSRVERSAGRVDLHWVEVALGARRRARMLRMRFEHSKVHDRLVALAREISASGHGGRAPEPTPYFRGLLAFDVLMSY